MNNGKIAFLDRASLCIFTMCSQLCLFSPDTTHFLQRFYKMIVALLKYISNLKACQLTQVLLPH